jgi:hypothetical protein
MIANGTTHDGEGWEPSQPLSLPLLTLPNDAAEPVPQPARGQGTPWVSCFRRPHSWPGPRQLLFAQYGRPSMIGGMAARYDINPKMMAGPCMTPPRASRQNDVVQAGLTLEDADDLADLLNRLHAKKSAKALH